MRLSNSSFMYFGLFLSKEMARLGHLGKLYTNLPPWRVAGLPRSAFVSQPLLAAPMALKKLGFARVGARISPSVMSMFDRWVAARLSPCDVFHSFSGFGLHSQRRARELGALSIVERGSSHIEVQDALLADEYARWGQPYKPIDPRIVEWELAEYEECDYLTVQSSFAERTFVDRGISADKLVKLPLGVDVTMFRPAPKRDRLFRVLYAGGCTLRKGIPYLLEAVAGLHKLDNFEFTINGRIPAEVEPILEKHTGRYRLLGFQPLDKLYETYSQASVLVLPTIEDGFAKVVTEAMACGVPVIATTNCGASDVLNDGVEGFIVPIRDPEAIREKILYLYENPDRRDEMAEAALERARTLADWHAYGQAALTRYRGLWQARGRA